MFHKEGQASILLTLFVSTILLLGVQYVTTNIVIQYIVYAIAIFLLIIVLQFFRNPKRNTEINKNHIVAPVDGKVVVIEEVFEKEYFKDKRLQVSIFMSP